MNLRKAERKKAKIKMAIQGPSGGGKTNSALLLAYGITGNWSKIAIVDTENGSADLYAHLGSYQVLPLEEPFTPERYISAVDACLKAGIEVIILDSISHCWDFLLRFHSKLQGNSFTNWNKVTPRQTSFIQKILNCNAHVIATMRTKQDYVLNLKDGKHVPEKVGLKAVQRDGVDYEFTVVFDIDLNHMVKSSKDRTGLFMDQPEFVITSETGQKIKEWCEQGTTVEDVRKMVIATKTVEELNNLYRSYRSYYPMLESDFSNQKNKLSNPKFNQNGIASTAK